VDGDLVERKGNGGRYRGVVLIKMDVLGSTGVFRVGELTQDCTSSAWCNDITPAEHNRVI